MKLSRIYCIIFIILITSLAACSAQNESTLASEDTFSQETLTSTISTDETSVLTDTPVPVESTNTPSVTQNEDNVETPTPTISSTVQITRAANADVTYVRAIDNHDGAWTFHVTVLHPDTGWEDYADGWDVVTLEGSVLKVNPEDPFTRLLLHPHENEQPFTRSQSGIVIPEGVTQVIVRAHDLVDGFGGKTVLVDLTAETGDGFEISR